MRRLPFEQRRSELVEAAIHVIAREGLAAASARAIVAEAQMPLGALHYIFESRDGMLKTLITEVATGQRNVILSDLETETMSKAETLEEVVSGGLQIYLSMLEQCPERELAVLELSSHGIRHSPELAAQQWESYQEVAIEALEKAAALCATSWSLPPKQIAKFLISALDGITLSWLATRDSAAMREYIDFLAKAFAGLAIFQEEKLEKDSSPSENYKPAQLTMNSLEVPL